MMRDSTLLTATLLLALVALSTAQRGPGDTILPDPTLPRPGGSNGTGSPPPPATTNTTSPPPPLAVPTVPTVLPAGDGTDVWAQIVGAVVAQAQAGKSVGIELTAKTYNVTSTLLADYSAATDPVSFALIGQGSETVLDCGGKVQALAVLGKVNVTLANLVIQNCVVPPTAEYGGGGAYIQVGATVIISGVTFAGNYGRNDTTLGGQGGGLLLAAPATPVAARVPVIVQRSNFYQNYARWGAGLYADNINAALNITDCTFEENVAENFGGGLQIDSLKGLLTIKGTDVLNNRIRRVAGGGMFILNGGAAGVIITQSSFTGNSAIPSYGTGMGVGGAILMDSAPGYFDIITCTFSFNNALAGGAFYGYNGTIVRIFDSSFDHNIAVQFSGAVCGEELARSTGYWDLYANTFTSNKATTFGGGVSLFNITKLDMANNTLVYNTAETGGGLTIQSKLASEIQMMENTFTQNRATSVAGGLVIMNTVFSGTSLLTDNVFNRNSAATHGGGAVIDRGSGTGLLLADNAMIENRANSAGNGGNGGGFFIYQTSTAITLTGGVFYYNKASKCVNAQAYNTPKLSYSNLAYVPADSSLASCLTSTGTTSSVGPGDLQAAEPSKQDSTDYGPEMLKEIAFRYSVAAEDLPGVRVSA